MANVTRPWGADGSDAANNRPSGAAWKYLGQQMGLATANVVADVKGWKLQQPGGGNEEILSAIGGLVTNLQIGAASVSDLSGIIHKTTNQVIKVAVYTNYGLNLGAANLANLWIIAISNDANVANCNLVYSSTESVPESGELIFKCAARDFSLANTSPATTFRINSTSIMKGGGQMLPRQPGVAPSNVAVTPFTCNVQMTVVI